MVGSAAFTKEVFINLTGFPPKGHPLFSTLRILDAASMLGCHNHAAQLLETLKRPIARIGLFRASG